MDNLESFCKLQDEIVKKGTEQTPLNYWLQMNNVDVKTDLPMIYKLTHMHRNDLFHFNWQLEEQDEKTLPHFIKHGYNWIFNGVPKDQRTKLMSETWKLVKTNYGE